MKEAKLITNENTWVVKCDRPSLEIDENTINGSTWFIGDYKWNPINFIGESLKSNCNECSLIFKERDGDSTYILYDVIIDNNVINFKKAKILV